MVQTLDGAETAEERHQQVLDELLAEISEKLQAGQGIDLEEYTARFPQLGGRIQRLLPAMQAMADLGYASHNGGGPRLGPSDTAVPIPGTLGDFRILRELGRGGMGVVYEAEQVSIGRHVALKVLPFAAILDPRQLNRFKNEARAAGTLDHPHIVSVYSVGTDRGVHYYAMQLVPGQSLAELIAALRESQGVARAAPTSAAVSPVAAMTGGEEVLHRHPAESPSTASVASAAVDTQRRPTSSASRLSRFGTREYFRSVAQLGIQAAEALDYAHHNGIVHRDVKPGNLLVDSEGKLWVTDFGLAHVDSDASVTMTGDIVGTLRYMSPEQTQAPQAVVDHRTDIYSLGATLYELLTLQPACRATSREAMLREIAEDEPVSPRKINPGVPRELATIVLKALEQRPEDRYCTVREMAGDLQRFLANRPIKARPPSLANRLGKWSRRHVATLWTAIGMSMVMGSLLAFTAFDAHSAKLRETREKNAALLAKTAASEERNAARLNQYYAEIVSGQADWQTGNIGRLEHKLLRHLPVADEPDRRGWEWYYLLSLCHPEQRTMFCPGATSVAWSPDGQYVATAGGVWDAASGEQVRRLVPSLFMTKDCAWSSDGQLLAWGVASPDSAVYVWDRRSDEVRALRGHKSSVWCVAFRPDGRQLASGSLDGTLRIWDVSSELVVQSLSMGSPPTDVAWSPDGKLLAAQFKDGTRIWKLTPAEFVTKFKPVLFQEGRLSWHPRGQWLAVCHDEVWYLLDTADWGIQRRQAHPRGAGSDIAWSPDGEKLAVAHGDIVTVWTPTGDAPLATIAGHRNRIESVDWSPDGERLVTADGEEIKIWNLEVVGAPEAISAGEPLDSLSWLTDSRTLQSVSAHDGSVTHWNAMSKCKLDVEPSVIADRAKSLLSPDRRLTATRSHAAITIRDAQTATIESILQPTANDVGWLSWSPDSTRLAIATRTYRADEVGLEFWDVKQPRLLSCWTRRSLFEWDSVQSVSWLENGTRVAAVAYGEPGDDGSIAWKTHLYVIDVATGAADLQTRPAPYEHCLGCLESDWRQPGPGYRRWPNRDHRCAIPGGTIMSEKVHSDSVTCLAFLPDGTAAGDCGAGQDGEGNRSVAR